MYAMSSLTRVIAPPFGFSMCAGPAGARLAAAAGVRAEGWAEGWIAGGVRFVHLLLPLHPVHQLSRFAGPLLLQFHPGRAGGAPRRGQDAVGESPGAVPVRRWGPWMVLAAGLECPAWRPRCSRGCLGCPLVSVLSPAEGPCATR